jgi:hypothetical protein
MYGNEVIGMVENEAAQKNPVTDERMENDEKSAAVQRDKKDKTEKIMKKICTGLTSLGALGAKYEYSEDEKARIFEHIQDSVKKAQMRFEREDDFVL